MLLRATLSGFVAVFLAASPAAAIGSLDNFLTIYQDGVGSIVVTGEDLGCEEFGSYPGGGSVGYTCDGSGETFSPSTGGFTFEISDWDVSGEFDPFVSSAFGFKNTGAASTFTIIISIPVAPLGPSTLIGGSRPAAPSRTPTPTGWAASAR